MKIHDNLYEFDAPISRTCRGILDNKKKNQGEQLPQYARNFRRDVKESLKVGNFHCKIASTDLFF
jgi:hypothetical protein